LSTAALNKQKIDNLRLTNGRDSHGITAHEKTVLNKTAVRNSLEIEYELVKESQ